jgi:bacterioferritin-associated ferredoxin
MIVCNCNCLKERDLEQAACPGMNSAEALVEALGCRFKCGRCVPYVQDILVERISGCQMA